MRVEKDFTFTINISSEGYTKKTDATACLTSKGAKAINRKKMCFFEHTLTVDEFLSEACLGHSFCSLYRFEPDTKYWYSDKKGHNYFGYPHYRRDSGTSTKGGLKIDFKRDEYFSGSQVIFVDVDYTQFTSISDYIGCLTFKPTCVYMSYSDNKNKGGIISRRFHLVYVFDELLNPYEFKDMSSTITKQITEDTNEEVDDCSTKMSQYMNGCYGNKEHYVTYNIYSINDIYSTTLNPEMENPTSDITEAHTVNPEMENDTTYNFDMSLMNDWDRLDQEEFIKQRDWVDYLTHTKHYNRVEYGDWSTGYQFIDDSYFRMYWITETQHDGSKRRKSLYERMCLRKIINPDITPMELTVNTMIDIIRFYDNSDGVLNSDFIVRNVSDCMSLTTEEIEYKFKGELKYLRDTTKPKKGIIYYSKEQMKEVNDTFLDNHYDTTKTVVENINDLSEQYNFTVQKSRVYDWLKRRNIKSDSKKLTEGELLYLTDYSLSANKNLKFIKSLGYKIGNKKYNEIYNKNKTKSLMTM